MCNKKFCEQRSLIKLPLLTQLYCLGAEGAKERLLKDTTSFILTVKSRKLNLEKVSLYDISEGGEMP